jgi:hypothetical protein
MSGSMLDFRRYAHANLFEVAAEAARRSLTRCPAHKKLGQPQSGYSVL